METKIDVLPATAKISHPKITWRYDRLDEGDDPRLREQQIMAEAATDPTLQQIFADPLIEHARVEGGVVINIGL